MSSQNINIQKIKKDISRFLDQKRISIWNDVNDQKNIPLEYKINLYLVILGARKSTLVEETNIGNFAVDEIIKFITIGKYRNEVYSDYEIKGNQPRYLISNKKQVTQNDFKKEIHSSSNKTDEGLGRLLGFMCPGEMSGNYSSVFYAKIINNDNSTLVDFQAEICNESGQYLKTLDKYTSEASIEGVIEFYAYEKQFIPTLKFFDFIQSNLNNPQIIFENIESIIERFNELAPGNKLVNSLKSNSNTNFEQFQPFWERNKNIYATVSSIFQFDTCSPVYPVSLEISNMMEQIQRDQFDAISSLLL